MTTPGPRLWASRQNLVWYERLRISSKTIDGNVTNGIKILKPFFFFLKTLKFCNIYFHCIYKFHNIIQITKPASRSLSIMELQSSACLSEHAGSCGLRYEESRAAGAGSSPHNVGLGRAQPGTWGRIQLLPQRSPGFNDIKLIIQSSLESLCVIHTLLPEPTISYLVCSRWLLLL